jgi:hypothetical protein
VSRQLFLAVLAEPPLPDVYRSELIAVAARVAIDFPAIARLLAKSAAGASIRCQLSTPTAKPAAPASAGRSQFQRVAGVSQPMGVSAKINCATLCGHAVH